MRIPVRSFLVLAALSCGVQPARAQLFISSNGDGVVGEFNASTGAVINEFLLTGLANPDGVAVSGNFLYVTTESSQDYGKVLRYTWNGTTATNPTTIVSGLNTPAALAISGTTLYVVDNLGGTVTAYNVSGVTPAPLYSAGAYFPMGVALSGSTLFVASYSDSVDDYNSGYITAFNATTGQSEGIVASGLDGLMSIAVIGNKLYAATSHNNSVASFTISGSTLANENVSFATGFNGPDSLAVEGNNLLVSNTNETEYGSNGSVSLVNGLTGSTLNTAFIGTYHGLDYPAELAVAAVPEPPLTAIAAGLVALGLAGWGYVRRPRLTVPVRG